MGLWIDAACISDVGKIRKNNEDNFFFDNKYLMPDQQDAPMLSLAEPLKDDQVFAIFDGMGGENFGEVAAYAAASSMHLPKQTFFFRKKHLIQLAMELNDAVVQEKQQLLTDSCGCTMAALWISGGCAYACNVGDSRIYRLRDGKLFRMSVDHVVSLQETGKKKAPLSQHLGIDPEDMLIEPYTTNSKIRKDDRYLLCSDGLTDMLTDAEIVQILQSAEDVQICVKQLVQTALDHGGRDNITAIVCAIRKP